MTETLLKNNNNSSHVVVVTSNGEKPREKKVEHIEPPDGGTRAYLVMCCAFMCNGILFGIINTYSVIYLSLQRQLKESGDEAASSKACKSENRSGNSREITLNAFAECWSIFTAYMYVKKKQGSEHLPFAPFRASLSDFVCMLPLEMRSSIYFY